MTAACVFEVRLERLRTVALMTSPYRRRCNATTHTRRLTQSSSSLCGRRLPTFVREPYPRVDGVGCPGWAQHHDAQQRQHGPRALIHPHCDRRSTFTHKNQKKFKNPNPQQSPGKETTKKKKEKSPCCPWCQSPPEL